MLIKMDRKECEVKERFAFSRSTIPLWRCCSRVFLNNVTTLTFVALWSFKQWNRFCGGDCKYPCMAFKWHEMLSSRVTVDTVRKTCFTSMTFNIKIVLTTCAALISELFVSVEQQNRSVLHRRSCAIAVSGEHITSTVPAVPVHV